MVVKHVFSGEYLPLLLATAKITDRLSFKLNRNNIFFSTLDHARICLVRFTIPSKGKNSNEAFETVWSYTDLNRDFVEISRTNPREIEFIVDGDTLTIIGKGDYTVKRTIDIENTEIIHEPEIDFGYKLIIGKNDLKWFRNLIKSLSKSDSLDFIKIPRKPITIVGYDYWDEKTIEIELPQHIQKKSVVGKVKYRKDLIKHLDIILKRLKPNSLILQWNIDKPLLVTALTEINDELLKYRYWIAPKAY